MLACLLLSALCSLQIMLEKEKEKLAHNIVQMTYKRHAALSRNGVMYKTVEIRPQANARGTAGLTIVTRYEHT